MKMEPHPTLKACMPLAYFCMEVCAAFFFFLLLIPGFIVGAIWSGILAGFRIGRDI